jgi:prepilin-type N-terminal cleavage/methylation domain-containing protein
LIELLVVIAVLSILAAWLLSGLAGAKDRAKSILCLSQLRQWSLALQIYAPENQDEIPREDPLPPNCLIGVASLYFTFGSNRRALPEPRRVSRLCRRLWVARAVKC